MIPHAARLERCEELASLRGRLQGLVFDLDGTLYVSDVLGEAINRAAVRYVAGLKGIDPADAELLLAAARRELAGTSGAGATLSAACLALGGDLRELHRRFAAEVDPDSLLAHDSRVVDLLKRLGLSHALIIYTNNNRDLAGRIMAAIGVSGLFSRVFTIEDTWRPKPDRATLEMILAETGTPPGECLFVGDRYDVDLALPAAVGCPVWLTTTIEELLELNRLA